jgi:hypothetical protein
MVRYILAATLLTGSLALAQEGPTVTQALVAIDSKAPAALTASNVSLKINNKAIPLTSVTPVTPSGAQVAILIDDGLRTSVGREFDDLRNFITSLPSGIEVFVGYMQNGRVVPAQAFTTDHAAAAGSLRLPLGSPGVSSSPYFALTDFTKRWPGSSESVTSDSLQPTAKARFVLMITNGVDPYNGSTRISNQDSPYVSASINDAQRAGAAVYSIYYTNAGIGGGRASFSGQSYLSQVADATGGRSYYQGMGNPVSMAPFLQQFKSAIAETYIATFTAPGNKDFIPIKFTTSIPKTKLQSANQVRPGTRLAAQP